MFDSELVIHVLNCLENELKIVHSLSNRRKRIESPERSHHPSFQSAIDVCPNLILAIYGFVSSTPKANDLVESLTCRSP
jgi:hypothetical protein